jgi:ubiquinone/menaquinone biosynthesis C-methylase UbiE
MEQSKPSNESADLDQVMKSQMEQIAPTYDDYMRKSTFGREAALRETTVRLAQIKPGDSVLEVGCGTGSLTLAAKRQVGPSGKVAGIDIIPKMIEISQSKAEQAHEDITFQLASITTIPFADNHFDVVMCSFMIFHMSEETRRKGIAEIYRVLKPQGRLFVLDLAMPAQRLQQAIAKRVVFRGGLDHDVRELLPLLEATGFSDLTCGPVKFSIMGLSILAFARGSVQKA